MITDEAAILLRVAGFGLVAGVAYWIVSGYEPLGSYGLLALGAGPGFAALIMILDRRRQGGDVERLFSATTIRRAAGLPPEDPPGPADLSAEDLGILPLPSIWPLSLSLGLAIAVTGLIFGLWLVVLGLAVFVVSIAGWLASITREQRYGRLTTESDAAAPPGGEALRPWTGEPGWRH